MHAKATTIPGLWLIEPRVFKDPRGFFYESFNAPRLQEQGIEVPCFMQDNHARSEDAGVLRGLHFQLPPMSQSKLVRVTRGRVLDVVADLRKGSPTYGKWESFELSAENFMMLLIPKGLAHGYLTLEPGSEFLYKVDAPYAPDYDTGIIWSDPDLDIDWPTTSPILSEKDHNLGSFAGFDSPFVFAAG